MKKKNDINPFTEAYEKSVKEKSNEVDPVDSIEMDESERDDDTEMNLHESASNKDNLFFHAEINDDGSIRLLQQKVIDSGLVDKAGSKIKSLTKNVLDKISVSHTSHSSDNGASILVKKTKSSAKAKEINSIVSQNELISYALNDRRNFTYRALLSKFLESYPFITADDKRNISSCINGVILIIGDPGSGKSAIDLKLSSAIANIKGLFHNSIINQCNKYLDSGDANFDNYGSDDFLTSVIDLFKDELVSDDSDRDESDNKDSLYIDVNKFIDVIKYIKVCVLQYAHELKVVEGDSDEKFSIFKRLHNHSYTGHYSCQEPVKDIQNVFSKGTKVMNPVNGFKYTVLSYDSVTSPMFSLGKMAAMSGGINLSNMKTTLALFDAVAAANNTSIILTVNSLGLEKNLTNALKIVADSMCSLVIDLNQSEIHVREFSGNRLNIPFSKLSLKTPCELDQTYKSDYISYPCTPYNNKSKSNSGKSDVTTKFNNSKNRWHFVPSELETAYRFNDLTITASTCSDSQNFIGDHGNADANRIITGSLFNDAGNFQDNMDKIRQDYANKNPSDLKRLRLYSDNAGKMNTEVREIDLTELFPDSSLNINHNNEGRSTIFNSADKDWNQVEEGNDYVTDIANREKISLEISRTQSGPGLGMIADNNNPSKEYAGSCLFNDAVHSNDRVLADYLDPAVSREVSLLYGVTANLDMIRADLAEYSTLPSFSKAAGFEFGIDEEVSSVLIDKKLQLILLSAYSEKFDGIDPFLTSKKTYEDAAQYRNYLCSVYDAHVVDNDD